jgi:3-oxoacyl-[acyl-carrier protein] reductase
MELEGNVALITGAGRGFGQAIAKRFAKAGADLVLNYRESKESCEAVASQVQGQGRRAVAIRADVSNGNDVERMVKEAIDQFGRIDILINNAGVMRVKSFVETTDEDWQYETSVNIFGPMRVTRAVLPHMIAQRYGKIVTISSQLALIGWDKGAVYSGTKGFVLTWTKSLAKEFGQYNINVNAIGPGSIVTAMNKGVYPSEEAKAKRAAELPLRRLGSTNDVAESALFLASDASSFLTGQMLGPNGGNVM